MSEQDYYTAGEAMQALGLSKAMFHRKVKQGLIPKITPVGYKQGVYPKRDIDALARAINLVFEHEHYEFTKSTIADQEEEMYIGIRCFGREFITPLAERIGFQRKSEFTFWSLKVDGRVVGYISMFRFPEQFLDDILTGRRIEREITVKEVLPFTVNEPFDIYIDVLALDPNIRSNLRKWYAGVLISRFTDTLLNLLGNGYRIRRLYTVTATQEGDALVREAGFQLLENKSQVPGRTAYVYQLDQAGIEHLKEASRRRVYHAHSRTEDEIRADG